MKRFFLVVHFVLFFHFFSSAHSLYTANFKIISNEKDTKIEWCGALENKSKMPKIDFSDKWMSQLIEKKEEQNGISSCQSCLFQRPISYFNGEIIKFDHLEELNFQVFISEILNGGVISNCLITAKNPYYKIVSSKNISGESDFLMLGFEHIIFGIDHLLFIVGLLLLIGSNWSKLFWTISSFTLAHSITFFLSRKDVVSVNENFVEIIIALSILFLVFEICVKERIKKSWSQAWPWAISFLMGLIHGLGFANSIDHIGIDEANTAKFLLFFNLGVELGQVFFIIVMIFILWIIRKLLPFYYAFIIFILTSLLGVTSTYWVIDRFINSLKF